MFGHVLLQVLSETESHELQQLSGAVLQLQRTRLQKFQADLPLWRTFWKLLQQSFGSNLAFLGHGVSEDQHIFLEALQRIRLAVPLWYLVPCRLRYHDEVSAQLWISRERWTEWRFSLIMFMMMSSESGYKCRSEINRKMKLRNVYSAQVSSTICQECETIVSQKSRRQRTMKHATSHENCHTRKSSHPCVRKTKAQARPNKKYLHNPTHVLSTKSKIENLTTLLDLSTRKIDHPAAVSCFSQSRVSEREPGAQTQDTHDQSSGTHTS